jgi:hypothetical protein
MDHGLFLRINGFTISQVIKILNDTNLKDVDSPSKFVIHKKMCFDISSMQFNI